MYPVSWKLSAFNHIMVASETCEQSVSALKSPCMTPVAERDADTVILQYKKFPDNISVRK